MQAFEEIGAEVGMDSAFRLAGNLWATHVLSGGSELYDPAEVAVRESSGFARSEPDREACGGPNGPPARGCWLRDAARDGLILLLYPRNVVSARAAPIEWTICMTS
jgi:hypothetical protein